MTTTIRQDIEACFGKPTDYVFDITKFMGRNRGRINIIGLRYMGLVVAGKHIQKCVEAKTGNSYTAWEFKYHMREWCQEYTESQDRIVFTKDGAIYKGLLECHAGSIYFCVPPELNLTIEALKEVV